MRSPARPVTALLPQCLGQNLAHAELQLAYPALPKRFPNPHTTVPDEEIRLKDDMAVYGVHALPVAWWERRRDTGRSVLIT